MLEQVTELNSMIMASSYSRSADLAPLRPCGVPPACGLGSPPTTLKTRRFGLKTLWQCVTKILLSRCYLFISSAFVLAIESYRFWRFQRIMTWKGMRFAREGFSDRHASDKVLCGAHATVGG